MITKKIIFFVSFCILSIAFFSQTAMSEVLDKFNECASRDIVSPLLLLITFAIVARTASKRLFTLVLFISFAIVTKEIFAFISYRFFSEENIFLSHIQRGVISELNQCRKYGVIDYWTQSFFWIIVFLAGLFFLLRLERKVKSNKK